MRPVLRSREDHRRSEIEEQYRSLQIENRRTPEIGEQYRSSQIGDQRIESPAAEKMKKSVIWDSSRGGVRD